ncbi:MAG TPA: hypothetical protein DDX92_05235 [Flavobacteriales bacterium]|nr:hypothetical protein [Flavobacteriales bacterium]
MRNTISLLLFLLYGVLVAQESFYDDTVNLVQVDISGTKPTDIPGIMSTETDSIVKTLQQFNSSGDLLKKNSSVYVKDYGPGQLQSIALRGASATHTRVLFNGLEISPATSGQVDFNTLPVYLFSSSAINYGNASFAKGIGGLGGSIEVNTAQLEQFTGLKGDLGISLGSFSDYRAFGGVKFSSDKFWSNTKLSLRTAANDFSYTDITQEGSPEVTQDHAQFDQTGISQNFGYRMNSNLELNADVLYVNTSRELPGTMLQSDADEEQDDEIFALQLGLNRYGRIWLSKNRAGYDLNRIEYRAPSLNFYSEITSRKWSFRSENRIEIDQRTSFSGILNLKSEEAIYNFIDESFHRTEGALLLGLNRSIGRSLEFGVALQPVYSQDSMVLWLPVAGISFNPEFISWLSLGANYARNAKFPSLNDLHWEPGGNTALVPEESDQVEINAMATVGTLLSVDLMAYYSEIRNWIQWVPGNSGIWSPENIKEVEQSGISINLKLNHKLQRWNFRYIAGYQYVRSIDRELNKVLVYTPEHMAHWTIFLSRGSFDFNLAYQYNGSRFIDAANETYLPDFDLVDFGASYTFVIENLAFRLGGEITNVLDKPYMNVVWSPMPGRAYRVYLTMSFQKK